MSREQEIASRLLRVASNAANQVTEEERSFTSLVAATRRNFRRSLDSNLSTRGRKPRRSYKKRIVLLKLANADFFPTNSELKFLRQRGLGEPNKLLEIGRDDLLEAINEKIILLFRPHIQNLLRMCGFKLAKCERSKRIIPLLNIENGADLEQRILQSKIVVVPLKDFPSDLQISDTELSPIAPMSGTSPAASDVTTIYSAVASTSGCTTTTLNSRRTIELCTDLESEEEEEDLTNSNSQESELTKNHVYLPEKPPSTDYQKIVISRADCLRDLLAIYSEEDIINKNLQVEFLGELGIDGGGLTTEMFNIFFQQCESVYFHGEECLVPFLPLNRRNEIENFKVIGRIVQHMLVLTGTLPTKLSRVTLMLIARPDINIEERRQLLIQDFLNFVNPYLRKLLKKALKQFSALTERELNVMQDFFQSHKFYDKPKTECFEEQIRTIATEILVETPRKLIKQMRDGVSPEKHDYFWRNCDFSIFLDMQTPTPTKLINCIATDPYLSNEENEVLHYFTMYVNCLDKEQLKKLIFLITGSFLMPDNILLKFNDSVGLSQRPLFSTCSRTLTLPKTYANYNELKNDLNICLYSEEAAEYSTY